MSEREMWSRCRAALLAAKGSCAADLTRIENRVGDGTPDVNYCIDGAEGWIELKQITEPRHLRPDTIILISHIRPAQRAWIARRVRACGRVWLLLHMQRSDWWMLFAGTHLPKLGNAKLQDMAMIARWAAAKPDAGDWMDLYRSLKESC